MVVGDRNGVGGGENGGEDNGDNEFLGEEEEKEGEDSGVSELLELGKMEKEIGG